jgi:hypothetical protein
MRINVAPEQHDLEKDHAGIPNGWASAEVGQHHLGNERLNGKKQKRANE